ncbi:MAG: hypothetical protein AAFZ15_26230 [Bacteroidota bacterium]
MPSKIIQRIQETTGIPNLFETLAKNVSPSDLQSLLMETYAHRVVDLSPSDVFKNYQQDRFVKPATSNPLESLAFDQSAFRLASESKFEPIELSPVVPLGSCSVVATASQNKIVSTVRNSEVLSDSTNALALEAAVRRNALLKSAPKNAEVIQLSTSHRLIRTQPLPDPRFLPHFRLFGLCSAGRDTGNFSFELIQLASHLEFYLRLMTEKNSRYFFQNIEVLITRLKTGITEATLVQSIFDPLKIKFPSVKFDFFEKREGGRNYYQQLCFQVNAENKLGQHFQLADGGFTDWTQKYLNNKKERSLISGLGSELVCLNFNS